MSRGPKQPIPRLRAHGSGSAAGLRLAPGELHERIDAVLRRAEQRGVGLRRSFRPQGDVFYR